MASISSNYYNFSSSLFSSISTGSSSSTSSLLGDYYSIKNGSYKKLLTAYYKKQNGQSTTDSTSDNTTSTNSTTSASKLTSADQTKLTSIKGSADGLKDATAALTATGSNSLFKKVEKTVTDATTGTTSTTSDYDMDKIASAVKDFAKSYNETITAAADTDNTAVLRKTTYMVSSTKANKNLLAQVGISIGTDNKLTVDETKLKSADISDLKTLFNGKESYADQVNSKAADISIASAYALNSNNLYGSNGKYSIAGMTGTLFDSFL